jgi:hypothetical protein
MTTTVRIVNDSVPGSGHDITVETFVIGEGGHPVGTGRSSTADPLKPGESVTTTVWSGNALVIKECRA